MQYFKDVILFKLLNSMTTLLEFVSDRRRHINWGKKMLIKDIARPISIILKNYRKGEKVLKSYSNTAFYARDSRPSCNSEFK